MKGIAILAALVALTSSRVALAAKAFVLTDRDDANACLPLGDGALAVATGGGLVLLGADEKAQVLTSLDGLPGTRAYAIARDGEALWVGTDGGAALVTLRPSPAIARTIAFTDSAVRAILPVSGGVYLGTWGAGLQHVRPDGDHASAVVGAIQGRRVAALTEHRGSLYVAYADGPLAVLDGGTLHAVAGAPTHGQALASLASDAGGTLVLGDLEGLFTVAEGVTGVSPVDARALSAGAAGLLVGTYGAGLLSGVAPGSLHAEAGVPRFVRGVGVRGGVRCAATTEGVFVDAGDHRWRRVSLGGPPSNDVTALSADADRVAVGTFDHGAAIYDRGAFRTVPGLAPDEAVAALGWIGKGAGAQLLLGTAQGVVRVGADGSGRRFGTGEGLPSSHVRSLLVVSDDRVLIGTDEGAALMEGDQVVPIAETHKGRGSRPLSSPMHATWSLGRSNDGTLWLGTTTGLYYGREGRFRRASVATGSFPTTG